MRKVVAGLLIGGAIGWLISGYTTMESIRSEFTTNLEREVENIKQAESLEEATLQVSGLVAMTSSMGFLQTYHVGHNTIGLGVLGLGIAMAIYDSLKSLGQRIEILEKSIKNNNNDTGQENKSGS